MQHLYLTRRLAILGAAATLGGCSALSSLNDAATPLDTYDLAPAPATDAGRGTGQTLLVARPTAPAGIATDRIMVKPGAAAITYLPDARWVDELPAVMQSLLIRSIAGTGRMGYVGPSEGGPVPDLALLTRIDSFEVYVSGEAVTARIDISLSLLRDRDQSVIKTRAFRNEATAVSDQPTDIVAAFQAILDGLLPEMARWVS
jgi:cholesterol transport system auxiliary component